MVEQKEMKNTKLYIDGHNHFYDNFLPELFFKSAEKNFLKHINEDEDHECILVFTEGKTNDFFNYFRDNDKILLEKGYTFEITGEENSLLVKKNNKNLFYIIQGRQIVTKENIEILSIGTKNTIEDGKPAETVIAELITEKKPAVLAWGFGKWLFQREKIIHTLISNNQSPFLFIGDNSARPVFWRTPKLYKYAEKKGYKIINGSDPLPLSGEEKKPGSYGFCINGPFNEERPAESLINLLIAEDLKIDFFGERDGTIKFFTRQIKMFLKKHLNKN